MTAAERRRQTPSYQRDRAATAARRAARPICPHCHEAAPTGHRSWAACLVALNRDAGRRARVTDPTDPRHPRFLHGVPPPLKG
jgi:hypothetical protein